MSNSIRGRVGAAVRFIDTCALEGRHHDEVKAV
jgi:hypothetical protein